MNLSAWFRNGDRHLAGVHFLRPNRYSARSQSPFLNQANLSRSWPLTILLLGLAGCSGSSTASPSGAKAAANLIESGNAALARGNLDQALADFSSAVDAQRDSAKARERRAAVYLQMKKPDQAVNDCNEALKIDGKFAPAYYTLGLAERDRGDAGKAIENLTQALDNGLERVDVLNARGALYYAQAKAAAKPDAAAKILDKALKDFDRAVKLDPHQTDSRMRRAEINLDRDDYASAVADCDEALSADPNLAAAHVLRARGECELGEIDPAVLDCDAAIRLDGRGQHVLMVGEAYAVCAKARLEKASELRTLDEVAECERAVDDCQNAIELSKKVKGDQESIKDAKEMRGLAHELRGWIYHALQAATKARKEYEQALSLVSRNPLLVSALLRRAETRVAEEDFAGALNDCNQAISIDSTRPEAYSGRGRVYALKQEYLKAVEDFTQAVSLNRKYAKAYGERALAYSAMTSAEIVKARKSTDPKERDACQEKANEFRQKCIDDATQAIDANRHLARAYLTRGLAYATQQIPEKALADFNAAIREDPKMVRAYYCRGMLLFKQLHPDLAIKDFKEASKLRPSDPSIDYRLAQVYREMRDPILEQQYLKNARDKAQKVRKEQQNLLEEPADFVLKPKKLPEFQPDVEPDALQKAKQALEKKLDATAER